MTLINEITAGVRRTFGRDAGRTLHAPAAIAEPRPARIQSRWPVYGEDEIEAVASVLRSGRVNALQHGDFCREFEAAFAELCDMPHAIALANGTLGLELALRALGIGPGDEVVVTSRSFIASASCVSNCGATPVFADVDPDTQNITADTVRAVMTQKTRAIIPVHLAGMPCEMDRLCELAREAGLKIIEDCAQAHGAAFRGRPVGSFGDASVFSFCTDKIISTGGEGGMLLLRDEDAWLRAWSYKDHGKDYRRFTEKAPSAAFRWVHNSVGTNFRLTEMQAAIGLRQLQKLDAWLEARRQRAAILDDAVHGLKALRTPPRGNHLGHANYKYYAFVAPERLKPDWSRDRILGELVEAGAPCQSGSCPEIYREQAFANGRSADPFPNARRLGETSILAPIDPTLTLAEIRQVGDILRSVVKRATA